MFWERKSVHRKNIHDQIFLPFDHGVDSQKTFCAVGQIFESIGHGEDAKTPLLLFPSAHASGCRPS